MHWKWYELVWHARYGMVWYALTMICIALPLYGMHWKWYGMVPHALALTMAMEMVCYGMVCIDNGNENGIHWQWKWYALVWYDMVCIANGMHWQLYTIPLSLHTIKCIQWYEFPCHFMVYIGKWYGMVCISIGNDNGMVPHALALEMEMEMVWYALEMVCYCNIPRLNPIVM
jgi:hypothetical protein